MKHLFFFQSLRPNVFTMEFVKKKLQHKRLLTEKGSFPSWTDIICSFKSCFVSQLVTQYHIYRVSFLYELRQYRHSNVDISPAIPLPSSAGPALRHAKPILGLVFWVQDDPQRKKFGSIWVAQALVTQPMLQLRPNWTELRSMDYYHQIFCRFRKCKRKVPPPSPLSTQKSPFTPPKEDFSHPLGE